MTLTFQRNWMSSRFRQNDSGCGDPPFPACLPGHLWRNHVGNPKSKALPLLAVKGGPRSAKTWSINENRLTVLSGPALCSTEEEKQWPDWPDPLHLSQYLQDISPQATALQRALDPHLQSRSPKKHP